jgi:hypothetical protein
MASAIAQRIQPQTEDGWPLTKPLPKNNRKQRRQRWRNYSLRSPETFDAGG